MTKMVGCIDDDGCSSNDGCMAMVVVMVGMVGWPEMLVQLREKQALVAFSSGALIGDDIEFNRNALVFHRLCEPSESIGLQKKQSLQR